MLLRPKKGGLLRILLVRLKKVPTDPERVSLLHCDVTVDSTAPSLSDALATVDFVLSREHQESVQTNRLLGQQGDDGVAW